MVSLKPGIIHLFDMVSWKDKHMLGRVLLDEVYVLANGVRRALVPLFPGHHLRWNYFDVMAQVRAEDIPASLKMLYQGLRFVLR